MNSIFTEENLLAFTTAARFGSFSKAAAELGVTTSAISYTIKRMETGLDVVLFVRNTRSIELTESGFYFYRKATDLLNDFHAIKRGIDTISQGIEARVRICINQLLYTPRHTARLLQVLKKQFPTCQITVTTEVYNGVWDSIINNQANIAIGAPDTLLDGGGIDYTEIGAIRWVFAIAPEHPLAFVPSTDSGEPVAPVPQHHGGRYRAYHQQEGRLAAARAGGDSGAGFQHQVPVPDSGGRDWLFAGIHGKRSDGRRSAHHAAY